jgi:ABC-type dipeptide/oligopeptide/nickel transport system permease component
MIRQICKKILILFLTLYFLATVVFFISRAIPGGPFDSENAYSVEQRQILNEKFGLDKSLFSQYTYYLKNLIKLDFGVSLKYMGTQKVSDILKESFPLSLKLGLLSFLVSLFFGVLLGVLSAYYQNGFLDFIIRFISVIGLSLPNYLLAAILIYIFSLSFNLLPSALYEDYRSLVLPTLTLALRPLAYIIRTTRVSVLETIHSDYIRTAFAKGLSTTQVLLKHALKPAFIPVLTLLGPILAGLISGSFVVEVIYALPGLGRYFVSSVLDRDYPLLMGLTLIYGFIIILINLLIDIFYEVIDPRIRDSK